MDSTGKIYLALAALFIIGGLIGLQQLSKRQSKEFVLGVCLALFLIGIVAGRLPVRQAMFVGGLLSTLGFAGGVVALFSLARQSRRNEGVPELAPTVSGKQCCRCENALIFATDGKMLENGDAICNSCAKMEEETDSKPKQE